MKSIIILGGGENQLPLIVKSKELGYRVILCDFREINPGKQYADIHYLVNTLDFGEVYEVCVKENPDGIITNSEPAIPIMTRIAESFGLPGNSCDGIEMLMSKSKFRCLQDKIGVYSPKHFETDSIEECIGISKQLKPPFLIKPCESSATRGTECFDFYDEKRIVETFNNCRNYSLNKRVCLEEFVQMPSRIIVDGDVFVNGNDILWNGMFSSTRNELVPMVPTTQTYPIVLSSDKLRIVKECLKKIFSAAKIKLGEFNIEGYFTKEGEFFVIEINVRQGGNGIPEMIYRHSGVDFSKMLVSLSVGDDSYWKEVNNSKPKCDYICHHPIYSTSSGVFEDIVFSEDISRYITNVSISKNKGDRIERCQNATSKLGYVTLAFDSREEQLQYYEDIDKHITINLR